MSDGSNDDTKLPKASLNTTENVDGVPADITVKPAPVRTEVDAQAAADSVAIQLFPTTDIRAWLTKATDAVDIIVDRPPLQSTTSARKSAPGLMASAYMFKLLHKNTGGKWGGRTR
jgi:hypothetical protein